MISLLLSWYNSLPVELTFLLVHKNENEIGDKSPLQTIGYWSDYFITIDPEK